jgi:hypothetical protein
MLRRSIKPLYDLHASHFWDITSINALDRVVVKFRRHGVQVDIIGMNEATATMVERLGTHDKPGAALAKSGHSQPRSRGQRTAASEETRKEILNAALTLEQNRANHSDFSKACAFSDRNASTTAFVSGSSAHFRLPPFCAIDEMEFQQDRLRSLRIIFGERSAQSEERAYSFGNAKKRARSISRPHKSYSGLWRPEKLYRTRMLRNCQGSL